MVENIFLKEKNAGYQHFLLFPKCYQKPPSLGSFLAVKVVLNPNTTNQFGIFLITLTKKAFKNIAGNQLFVYFIKDEPSPIAQSVAFRI